LCRPLVSVHIPRGTVHRNQNLTDKPARSIELNIWDKDKPGLGWSTTEVDRKIG
jgi:hypothetical protein